MTTHHHKPKYFVSDQQGSAGNEMKPAHHKPHKPNYSGELRASDHAGASLDIEAIGRMTMAKVYCDAANMPPIDIDKLPGTPEQKQEFKKFEREIKASDQEQRVKDRAKANREVPGFCP
jgi:hypothetical protein